MATAAPASNFPTGYAQPTINPTLTARDTIDPSSIFDNEWVKSTFVIKEEATSLSASGTTASPYELWIRRNRYATTASHKFASTSPGMSAAVNPKPQFTRYCDIRDKGRITSRPNHINLQTTAHGNGLGMGGYYSEAIDDNAQRVYFRFGVPSYMPLPIWVMKAFDIDKAVLQGRGTITSNFLAGVGLVASFFAFVAAPVFFIAMTVIGVIGASSRFYSVRPTMYIYWSTVDNILNSMVARRTMLPQMYPDYTYKLTEAAIGSPEKVSRAFLASLHAYIPDLVDEETGRISVFAIALRGQAAYNRIKIQDMKNAEARKSRTVKDGVNTEHGGIDGKPVEGVTSNLSYGRTDADKEPRFMNKLWAGFYNAVVKSDVEENPPGLKGDEVTTSGIIRYSTEYTNNEGAPLNIDMSGMGTKSVDEVLEENLKAKKSKLGKYSEYLMAELSDGSAFAVFNVEATGSIGESFSSSFGGNPIESTFNAISAKSRNLGSMLSGLKDIPLVGDAIGLAADATAVVLSKGTSGMINPLLALAYGVNVSMPKIWESSSAKLPSSSYKIKLVSPYGNAYSQLFNIYLPLSMLLAGALPRGTGASSYMSPFFCECFDKGRNNIQLGMISNLSITRGTSNLAFTRAGHPNALDIDLSVDSLDEIVSVDVNSSGVIAKTFSAIKGVYTADGPFVGYINTLTAVDINTLAFRFPMYRLRFAEAAMNLKSVFDPDPAAYAAMTVGTSPLGYMNIFLGESAAALQSLGNY